MDILARFFCRGHANSEKANGLSASPKKGYMDWDVCRNDGKLAAPVACVYVRLRGSLPIVLVAANYCS